ncbi:MAG: CRISPR-associated endonuclease Cas1 [Planctomycetes bacterium]|nr:CRISPR-associated endonuclease Cas1 [Planctomycetota bacterium]
MGIAVDRPAGAGARFDEPLPARMLNEYAYCPRLFHLMHVEGRWDDNAFTADGRAVHKRVDQFEQVLDGPEVPTESGHDPGAVEGDGDAPPEVARSVALTSEALGLVAKLDLVSTDGDEAVPVETKRGRVPDTPERCWEPERVQLMAQGLLLREHGYRCDHGFLYFRGSRTRVEVPFTPALESRTRELLSSAREAARSTVMPMPLEDSPKCRGCSLNGICLPDETLALAEVPPDPERPEVRRLYPVRDEAVPLYVQHQGAQVGKRGGSLTVRFKGEELATARLHDISQLVLCGNVAITAQAFAVLTEAGIPVVHMTSGHWFHGITHGMGLRNAYDRAAQFRAAADPECCLGFARAVVEAKIRNQRTLLRRNGEAIDDRVLKGLAADAAAAATAPSAETLLGIEGSGAARYFSGFDRMLRSEAGAGFDFASRNRRPPKDPVNAMLSFAYAMLSKELTVAILAEGLDPWWGLYHAPRHGRPALALDLMEEFRPLVADSAVVTAINTRMVSRTDFVVAASGCAMEPDARKALIRAFEARLDQLVTHPQFDYRLSWRATIRLQVRLFSRWLRGDVPTYVGMMTR